MNNNVLITGPTGFVGSHLAKELFQRDYSVHVLIRKGSDVSRLKSNLPMSMIFHVHEVDLSDQTKLFKIVKKINPSIIYHFAANPAYGDWSVRKRADKDIQTNIVGTWNLLREISECDYDLFVNAGSSSEYGFKNVAMNENDILEPNSYHSFAKAAQTNLVHTYGLVEKRPVITLRLFSVYGPFEKQTRLIPAVINACLNKESLKLSSPTVVRDFVFVKDVIDLCMKIDELKKHTGQVFNVGTGKQTSIGEVVDIASSLTGYRPECLLNEDKRSWDTQNWVADCTKTEKILGWKHSTDIESGLKKTIEWMTTYGQQ